MHLDLWKEINFSPMTLTAIEAALQAGELLRKGFGSKFSIHSKEGIHNLVTEYDHASEKLLINYLLSHFPNHCFLSEECGEIGKGEVQWIIDPLDGTVNFAHGIPVFSISIGARKKGKLLLGVIYQPITHELFAAETGKGSFLNGKRIQVSSTNSLQKAFLATGFPYNLASNPHHCIEHFVDILRLGIPIRRMGSAAIDMAYVAAGRFDGYFEVSLAPWDCAAGLVLVQEAGGISTNWRGENFSLDAFEAPLVTNGHIHQELSALLRSL